MKKKGMVIEIKNRNAIIMTETGEFTSVKFGSSIPICGEDYEGYEVKDRSAFKKFFISTVAAMFIFILAAMDYYNPVKAVELDMNSKIMLKLNRWNRVMAASAPDKKGEDILSRVKIKNTTIDKAVEKLILEAKQEKVIKSVSEVKVSSIKGEVDLSSVKNNIEKESLTDRQKMKDKVLEPKNENNTLKAQDDKSTDIDKNLNLQPNNTGKGSNNANSSESSGNKVDNIKNKTNNATQSNVNKNNVSSKNKNTEENEHNNSVNKAKGVKNKDSEKSDGSKKK